MKLEIKNCNNIDYGNVELAQDKLNIKFAPNGSGKSSIAKALLFSTDGRQEQLLELLPFKYRKDNPENKKPEVIGAESLKTVMCFNEEYVDQFVYKPDELITNSFDILIRTDVYRQIEKEIEELISNIKKLFLNNAELEKLITTLKEMGNAFKLTREGLSKSSTGMRGLAVGNKLQHIPTGLEAYKPFIQSDRNVVWIDWQTKGCEFSELSENCPFCTSQTEGKKEQIAKVGQEYDKSTIKNLINIIRVIETLGDYFASDAQEKLKAITTLKDGLENEHVAFLASVKNQIDNFTDKLERLRTLSSFQFKDSDKVAEKLPSYKLDFAFFSELNSQRMREAIAPINSSIDSVISQAGKLQGKINQQRIEMKRTVQQHQTDINNFLAYAGYRYAVEIAGDGEEAQLKLRHVDYDEHLSGGEQHLSFGEKNAFAIVLFMYECLAKKPDLIILDDPISSFDKNKKYAILEMLFRRETSACLKDRTVLMLTHDVEPIIDTTKSLAHKFGNHTSTSFLKLSDSIVKEIVISKDDVQTFSQICKSVLASEKDELVKLIYLRRHFEISNELEDSYQVISNILHKRKRALDTRETRTENNQIAEMDAAKFKNGCLEISKHLPSFSYDGFLTRVTDDDLLKSLYNNASNGYEKLQIFRLLDKAHGNPVIQKFINETYHIENEYICQLDPSKFDMIPEYVVAECNKILESE